MTKRLGVIDIGTNTFHLLIVNWNAKNSKFETLVRKRFFVKLGADRLDHITTVAYQNGLNAMASFKEIIQKHNCHQVRAFGTSVIRNADNAIQFCNDVKQKTGIEIQEISGDKEASLILKGVQLSYPFTTRPCLIMDIGGGSVEFIIANKEKMFYAESFKIGVAVLRNLFHQSEPISHHQIFALKNHLAEKLTPLFRQLKIHSPQVLIGASGTFDVLENVLPTQQISPSATQLEVDKMSVFVNKVISKNLQEREMLSEIPNSRIDLIVVALILVEYIWDTKYFDQLAVTSYTMKEGMIYEMIQELK